MIESATVTAVQTGRGRFSVSLSEYVDMHLEPQGGLILSAPHATITLKRPSPGLVETLRRLTHGRVPIDDLSEGILKSDGINGVARFYYHLGQIVSLGLVQHTAMDGDIPLATIRPTGRGYCFAAQPIDTNVPYLLSRFAYVRRQGSEMVLESPLGYAQLVAHDSRAAALVLALAEPRSVSQVVDHCRGLDEAGVEAVWRLLLTAGALVAVPDGTPNPEETDPALSQWSFPDLLFHSRSRFGRHLRPFGATFRHVGRSEPLPALRPAHSGEIIDLDRLGDDPSPSEPSLARLMDERRSVRSYGAQPITLAQLSEFLYRVARVRWTGEQDVVNSETGEPDRMPVSDRPYPSGGRTYELEFYLTVDACDGLPSGLYHYDPLEHRLTHLRVRDRYVEQLLAYASIAAPGATPQVLITLAARFQRVSWKYDAIAYATILKHVGIVYQTMYLVATAMRLAPCALGSGDADLFAEAIGTDFTVETSVGDFMLGSLPDGPGAATGIDRQPG